MKDKWESIWLSRGNLSYLAMMKASQRDFNSTVVISPTWQWWWRVKESSIQLRWSLQFGHNYLSDTTLMKLKWESLRLDRGDLSCSVWERQVEVISIQKPRPLRFNCGDLFDSTVTMLSRRVVSSIEVTPTSLRGWNQSGRVFDLTIATSSIWPQQCWLFYLSGATSLIWS